MRYLFSLIASFLFFSSTVSANWQKINDVDYVWGPFTIYNISLFSETGEYKNGTRPLMLSLKYMKPVDGRDFAISLARSWSNLGITLPEQEKVVDRLRKIMPNIKKGDMLSYIALQDKGYFVLNKTVIAEEFNQDFNNAVVAVWLDERVEIGKALLSKQHKVVETVKPTVQQTKEVTKPTENPQPNATEAQSGIKNETNEATNEETKAAEQTQQGVGSSEKSAKLEKPNTEEVLAPQNTAVEQNADKANEEKVNQEKMDEKPKENTEKKETPQAEEIDIWDAIDPVFLGVTNWV